MGSKENQDFEINKGLRLLAKTSVIVFIGIALSKIFTYIYRIIIARTFGPEIYGVFSLSLMIIGFFVSFSSLGLTDGLLRFISFYRGRKQYKKIRYLFYFTSIILVFSSIISSLILFFSAEFISLQLFHEESLIIFLQIFSILIPLTIFSSLFLNILRAFEEASWSSFIWNIFQNLVKLIGIVILIWIGFKTNAIIFSYFLSIFAMLLISYLVCRYKLSNVFGKSNLNKKQKTTISSELFSYSWPIMFSGIITTVFYWIDSFSLGFLTDVSNVGIYNAAVPVIGLLTIAPSLFTQLFLSLMTKEFSRKNYEVIKVLGNQVAKWILILNIPVFVIIFLFPGIIINTFFGVQYLAAATPLQILSIGALISSLVFLSNDLLSMAGKSKVIFINIIFASVINIILNWILISLYGLNGAAIATSIVGMLWSVALVIEVKFFTKVILLKKVVIKIILVSLIPSFLLFFLKQIISFSLINLIFFGIFFALVYTLLIFITGCLDKNDFEILKSIKKKIKPH